ncbi:2-keto-4-pentenoate hydratase/2-oxohepta-3-ene-1,7-dioic acid hydratase in catechol pathway [Streptosporangium becharense]|uniref:2-keto-4-pentenoate hydratase/2-oxohepta-3-ene-1,7-dioic acid hydratase in catechol pathway n=1 Tax=Streptosporangium becharense TaxID=1816182 RepID=A0A7W9IBR7_9ACTN|nr:fumarylacetoacetate hydrolase family protein [Streptosporangium becharense]MBB2914242.1 2-keto-4-pentenoate hydratase/2-oxohepta-3-ene-1,7-dioic acid hydratase in catechol pathway [Streptosporangium becharense]MBB5817269.1 2-keto-4-pentenoate hydratase/2-oxohepta-3-ene-1,7-dioic acid hydratase in catechol pathway [Streptosporangium becharense]
METYPPLAGPFALGTFSSGNGPAFPGLVTGDRVLDLRTVPALGAPPDDGGLTTRTLLERWDDALPLLHAAGGSADGRWLPSAGLRVHAPVEPRQILQSGANYRTHVIDLAVAHEPEGGRPAEQVRAEVAAMMDRRAAEDQPYVFVGLPSAVTGPYDDVVIPAWCAKPDWELELAAVIGRPAFRVPVERAADHVAAYTIANDLTARELVFRRDMPEIGTDWLRAKNAPTFTPLGPYLVPSAFVADPGDLQVTLRLNGEIMQDESTKDMIFDVARLVSYVSQTVELLPGDLVLTGSPAGNGMHWGRLLEPGDVMEGTITGLGLQRNRCVAESARPVPRGDA